MGAQRLREARRVSSDSDLYQKGPNFRVNPVNLTIGFLQYHLAVPTFVRNGIDHRETGYIEHQNQEQGSQHGTKDVFCRILIAAS